MSEKLEIKNLPIDTIEEIKKQFGDKIQVEILNLPKNPTMAFDSALYDIAINVAAGLTVYALSKGIEKIFEKQNINNTMVKNTKVVINNITINDFSGVVEKEQSINHSEDNSQ